MIDYTTMLDTINVLVVEPACVSVRLAETSLLKEADASLDINYRDGAYMLEASAMEIDGYDVIIISVSKSCPQSFLQEINQFCSRYWYLPIVIATDSANEEIILSYLSLGVQEVVDVTPGAMSYAEFRIRLLSSISRQLKTRITSESEDLYKVMFEYGLDVVFLLSDAGHILYASPNVESILGFRSHDLVAKNFSDYINDNTELSMIDIFSQISHESGDMVRHQVEMKNSNGGGSPMELTVRNMVNDSAAGCLVVNCHLQLNGGESNQGGGE